MKKFFFTLSFSAAILSSIAQVKCNVNRAYAYFTVSIPGAQIVDEKGDPVPPVPQVERFIYFEYNGKGKPKIDSVYYNKKPLAVTLSKVEGKEVTVGKKSENERPTIIRAYKGGSVWRLDILIANNNPQIAAACNDISIRLKTTGKICTYKIPGGETKLFSLPRY